MGEPLPRNYAWLSHADRMAVVNLVVKLVERHGEKRGTLMAASILGIGFNTVLRVLEGLRVRPGTALLVRERVKALRKAEAAQGTPQCSLW